MKMNLTKEQHDAIDRDLLSKRKSHFKFNDRDFYIRMDEVSFNVNDSMYNQVIRYEIARADVINEIKAGLGKDYVFTSFAISSFKEVLAFGYMTTVFYFTNSKLDSEFPNDLVPKDQGEFIVVENDKK